MNYYALGPKCYKRSVVEGFVHRVYRAYSSWENFHDTVEKVKMILQQNQYPQDFYDPIISNTIVKLLSSKVNQKDWEVDATRQNVFIEYRGIATNHYKKNEVHGSIIRTGYNSANWVCPGCNANAGQTSRHLITRFKEHRYKRNQPVCAHFVLNHKCTHSTPTLNDVKILASTSRSLNFLLTLETLNIREIKPEFYHQILFYKFDFIVTDVYSLGNRSLIK